MIFSPELKLDSFLQWWDFSAVEAAEEEEEEEEEDLRFWLQNCQQNQDSKQNQQVFIPGFWFCRSKRSEPEHLEEQTAGSDPNLCW